MTGASDLADDFQPSEMLCSKDYKKEENSRLRL